MDGIDTTEIVRLRELAKHLDWYRAYLLAQDKANRTANRAAVVKSMSRDARREADEIERADGLPAGSVGPHA